MSVTRRGTVAAATGAGAAALLLPAGPGGARPAAAAQDEVRIERVRFAAGKTSATVHDRIKGYQVADYRLGAKAGQTMRVALKTDNDSSYFNVSAPGSDEAMFNGSMAGDSEFGATLPADGEYTVRVYMMRNEARRGAVATYEVSFSITGP